MNKQNVPKSIEAFERVAANCGIDVEKVREGWIVYATREKLAGRPFKLWVVHLMDVMGGKVARSIEIRDRIMRLEERTLSAHEKVVEPAYPGSGSAVMVYSRGWRK